MNILQVLLVNGSSCLGTKGDRGKRKGREGRRLMSNPGIFSGSERGRSDLISYCDLCCSGDADAVCGRGKLSHLVKVQMRQDFSLYPFCIFY